MMVNTNNMVSLTEANQNFSKVARLADERGPVARLRGCRKLQTKTSSPFPTASSPKTGKPMRNWPNEGAL